MNTNGTYYDLLDVDVDASEEEVQSAYRDLVRETHPDVSDDPNAREQMVELTKARNVLTDEQKRAEYDAEQNIGGTDTRRTVHETTETESASSQSQYHDTGRSESRRTQQSNRSSTSSGGGQTAGSGTYSTAREQTRSKRERNRRARTRTHTRTGHHDRTSQTTSESGSIGSISPRLYLKYLYSQRGRLFRAGYGKVVFGLMNFCTLGLVWYWNWERVRSYLTSPTALRLGAAFGLWLVIDLGVKQINSDTIFDGGGILLIGLCLFCSYLGHDILKEYTNLIGDPLSERFDRVGNIQFWLVIGANLLALGLFFWAKSSVPFGGIFFAFGAVVSFLGFTLLFGIFTILILFAIGANVSETILGQTFILGPVAALLLSLTTLFTPFLTSTTLDSMISEFSTSSPVPVSAHPWVSAQLVGQVGVVDLGVFINALIAGLMVGSWFWSLLAVFRLLTKTPWDDRFERGYRIRPGFWNFLVVLPFVIYGWMLVYNITFSSLSIGSVVVSFTTGELLLSFGVLPVVLTSLYMLRRQVETWISDISKL